LKRLGSGAKIGKKPADTVSALRERLAVWQTIRQGGLAGIVAAQQPRPIRRAG
jgi:hypothetical protein